MNIRIAVTRSLLLKNTWRSNGNYCIDPGSYFLEIKKIEGLTWLMLEGRQFGLPLNEWRRLKNKGVLTKSLLSKILI